MYHTTQNTNPRCLPIRSENICLHKQPTCLSTGETGDRQTNCGILPGDKKECNTDS